ncbi:MAG: LamG-like jellyroll fold domain-containing protein [Candidatus Heimdallarchaeota archaeon]
MFKFIRNPNPHKKPPYGSRIDPTHPLAQGLVGCWLMNEGGGSKIFDLMLGIGGVAGSGSPSPSWDSKGIYFPGVNSSCFYYTSHPIQDIVNQCSVVFCFRTIDTSYAKNGRIISTKDSWSSASGFEVSYNPDTNKLEVIGSGSSAHSIYEAALNDGLCHNIEIIFDGTSDKVFIDGIENSTGSIDTLTVSTEDLGIGDRGPSANSIEPFKGILHYLYVFRRALAESEIAHLSAEPYSFILVPQYWYMVDFGVVSSPPGPPDPGPTGFQGLRIF